MSQVPGRRVALLAATLLVSLVGGLGGIASAATISGQVLEPSGLPATSAEPICIRTGTSPATPFTFGATMTDANGNYTLTVDPGTYIINFNECPYYPNRTDAPTYLGPTGRLADATSVTVHDGDDLVGMNQTMRPGATLSGHVYAGAGTATPATACLQLVPVDGPLLGMNAQVWTLPEDGSYAYTWLDPDFHYKLSAAPCPQPGYLTTWYDGVATAADATPITPATGIDIHLLSSTPVDPPEDDPGTGTPTDDGSGTPTDGNGTPTDTGTQKADTGSGTGTPPAVVAPTAPAPVPPVALPGPVVAKGAPVARAAFGTFGTQRLGAALGSGLRLPLRCAAACSARVSISVGAATANRLKLPRTLTTVRAKLKAGSPTVLIVGLPSSVRRAFAHEQRATFSVTVSAAGKTLRHTLSLKR